jgi:hypothetical protein
MKSGIKVWMVLTCMFCATWTQAQVEEDDDDEYVTKPKIEREADKKGSTGNENPEADRKFFFGGDFGLSFGDFTFVNLSPRVGYRINQNTFAGGSIRYTYLRLQRRDSQTNQIINQFTQEENWIGAGLFFQRSILDNFFVGIEPELIQIIRSRPQEYRALVPYILVGGGLLQKFGNSITFLGLYYNITHEQYPLTPSPIVIRAGFGF